MMLLTFLILITAVVQNVFSSFLPNPTFELSMTNKKIRQRPLYLNSVQKRRPSISISIRKLKQISTILPLFKHLPKPIIGKVIDLYKQRKTDKLLKLLSTVEKLLKLYQLQKCKAIFSFHLCSNSSAQPFFLWAKMSANKIVKG